MNDEKLLIDEIHPRFGPQLVKKAKLNEKTGQAIVSMLKAGAGSNSAGGSGSSPRISVDSLADDVREILPKLEETFLKTEEVRKILAQRNDRDELNQVRFLFK